MPRAPSAPSSRTIRHFALGTAPAILALPAIARTDNNPDFRLNNRGQQAVNSVHVSSSVVANRGVDRLGVNDVCLIRSDGRDQEGRQVNTRNLTDLNFS